MEKKIFVRTTVQNGKMIKIARKYTNANFIVYTCIKCGCNFQFISLFRKVLPPLKGFRRQSVEYKQDQELKYQKTSTPLSPLAKFYARKIEDKIIIY